jgi:FMN phosphatase YigB (HAD superfamily)
MRMTVLKYPTVFFDVDDTLVMWDENLEGSTVCIECDGHINHMVRNEGNIEELKRHKSRGVNIIVWSKGGYYWAEKVVHALGLDDYVDVVMTKPICYYDDLKNPLGVHRHLKLGEKYGKDRG